MSFINSIWYGKGLTAFLAKLPLLPFSGLFGVVSAARRAMYAHGIMKKDGPVIPVVVIGGITVGGTGKTPTCIALVNELKSRGFNPGVLSRGYKGSLTEFPCQVPISCDPAVYGDEPALIRAATKVPVVVDPDRRRGADYLAGLGVDVVILDDGLQHYALDRDVEICVLDGARMLGNGHLMPAGPLRESSWRLKTVDSVVVTGAVAHLGYFPMMLKQSSLDPVNPNSHESLVPGEHVCAFSGIGNPDRFYKTLEDYGFIIDKTVDVGDHNRAPLEKLKELAAELPVVMTAKDAIKYRKEIEEQNLFNIFVLNVQAQLSKQFFDDVVSKIKQSTYKVAERRRKREQGGYKLERVKAIEVVPKDKRDPELSRDSHRSLSSRAVIKSIISDKKGSISAMDLYRAELEAAAKTMDNVSSGAKDETKHSLKSQSGQHIESAKQALEEKIEKLDALNAVANAATSNASAASEATADTSSAEAASANASAADAANSSEVASVVASASKDGLDVSAASLDDASESHEERGEAKSLRKQIKSRIERHEGNVYKLEVANDSSEDASYNDNESESAQAVAMKTGTDAEEMVDAVSKTTNESKSSESGDSSYKGSESAVDELRTMAGINTVSTSSNSYSSSYKYEDDGKDIFPKKKKKFYDPKALPRELRRKSK